MALRKQRGLTQQALADLVEMHISQIRRYESGQSQPTFDAIRKLALALSVSGDMYIIRPVIETSVLPDIAKAAECRFTENGGSSR